MRRPHWDISKDGPDAGVSWMAPTDVVIRKAQVEEPEISSA